MTRIELAARALDDIERFAAHLKFFGAADVSQRIDELVTALDTLTHNPLIGRPARGGKRELIIGRSTRGYVALYRYLAELDVVVVLAIRAQRERRYKRRPRT